MHNRLFARSVLLLLLLFVQGTRLALAEDIYQSPDAFLTDVFDEPIPAPVVVWLTGERGKQVEEILGHQPESLRTRYWSDGERTVWILHEVGKERPITAGIVIGPDGIDRLRILVYRENRGAEVRFPFFTQQFKGASLAPGMMLDRKIDNITGATLSVAAIRRISRLALFLHQEVTR